MMVLKKQ